MSSSVTAPSLLPSPKVNTILTLYIRDFAHFKTLKEKLFTHNTSDTRYVDLPPQAILLIFFRYQLDILQFNSLLIQLSGVSTDHID